MPTFIFNHAHALRRFRGAPRTRGLAFALALFSCSDARDSSLAGPGALDAAPPPPLAALDASAPEREAGKTVDDPAPLACACSFAGGAEDAGVVSALAEASGLAASRAHDGILYAHNDSGDSARVFMIGTDGALRTILKITGAKSNDWEDLAVGPCPGGSCVFLADIGDNAKNRDNYRIYRVPEPAIDATTAAADTFKVEYPDGSHNAETLLVDGNGALYILTKEDSGPVQLYALGVPGVPGSVLQAVPVATFTPALSGDRVTGGDFFAGECPQLAIRTYGGVALFRGSAGEGPAELIRRVPTLLRSPNELQGESVAFSKQGNALYTVSEGASPMLHRYRCLP
jgi:hypothetical protein